MLKKVREKARARGGASTSYAAREWDDVDRSTLPAKVYDKVISPCLSGNHIVADIGRMDFPSLREMLKAIRHAARRSGQSELWVVLINHSKYISDFSDIDRFLNETRKYPAISRHAQYDCRSNSLRRD